AGGGGGGRGGGCRQGRGARRRVDPSRGGGGGGGGRAAVRPRGFGRLPPRDDPRLGAAAPRHAPRRARYRLTPGSPAASGASCSRARSRSAASAFETRVSGRRHSGGLINP